VRCDQDEAIHSIRVSQRHELRDHAAHRHAETLGALPPDGVEDRDGLVGHDVERVVLLGPVRSAVPRLSKRIISWCGAMAAMNAGFQSVPRPPRPMMQRTGGPLPST
jgi:hypothetical protein